MSPTRSRVKIVLSCGGVFGLLPHVCCSRFGGGGFAVSFARRSRRVVGWHACSGRSVRAVSRITSCRLVAGSRWRDALAGWGCPAAPCSCRGGRRGARWKLHVAFTPSDVSLLLTPERPGSSRCRCPRCLCGQIPGHTCPSSKLSARGRNLLPKPSPPGESRARRRPKVWLHLAPRTAAALPWRPAGPLDALWRLSLSLSLSLSLDLFVLAD